MTTGAASAAVALAKGRTAARPSAAPNKMRRPPWLAGPGHAATATPRHVTDSHFRMGISPLSACMRCATLTKGCSLRGRREPLKSSYTLRRQRASVNGVSAEHELRENTKARLGFRRVFEDDDGPSWMAL